MADSLRAERVEPLLRGRLGRPYTFVDRCASTQRLLPDDAPEGDGVVMGYVHDRPTGRSDLVLLDAQTLEDVAAVHLPGRVPAGFHGNWAPAERG